MNLTGNYRSAVSEILYKQTLVVVVVVVFTLKLPPVICETVPVGVTEPQISDCIFQLK